MGHTTPPVKYVDENPMEDHPGLTPLENKKIKRLAGKRKASKVSVKVGVEVAHGSN